MAMYADMEESASLFTSHFAIACPPSCGTCCEHFTPAITGDEATLVALYLLYVTHQRTLFDALYTADTTSACPLYDPQDPHHCQVYPVRPIVCRSFNSLPSRDKNGNLRFRSCRFTDKGYENRILDHTDIEVLKQMKSMSDFGSSVISGDAEALPAQVLREISKLLLTHKYAQEETNTVLSDDHDDDDMPPQDVAV
ncbi:MAG: YkgJ family cysteine cluster protein [Sphaerochaetaceae bacterium]|nr:YkgJ family cysteine cluster protein [Sphaerochaetaceae bacterium]